ncbi:hypothetical protein BXY85_1114 [Roseivirga pacifica]|uniref:Uncharacterized protein n=1 Tax=Roseivirga pacifica TaxID=1267423 RepID=A0A1I0M5I9_9BACT|nr:hypothetical protein BXY85_1114 [Roseivirga pacifica]SEV83745.1 hypothetical protein SAMN05216290_0098 [Roseivirga pacifica]
MHSSYISQGLETMFNMAPYNQFLYEVREGFTKRVRPFLF